MNILLADLNLRAAFVLNIYVTSRVIFYSDLVYLTGVFLGVLKALDYPLEKLIELNYSKLNSDETNHGWKGAR